jgi:hypothetical protein
MENKSMTAVEWLVKELFDFRNQDVLTQEKLIEQAKQMEKEQINKAYYDGYYEEKLYDARSYYTDTYGERKEAGAEG